MRDLLVPLGLLAMIGAAVAIRTARGWGPTQRDRLEHQCQQRKPQPTACVQLGYDFVKGTTGPVELDEGLKWFDRACSKLRFGDGCYGRGVHAMRQKTPKYDAIAVEAFGRGCELRHPESCTQSGGYLRYGPMKYRDAGAAVVQFTKACGGGSAGGCSWLGDRVFDTGWPEAEAIAGSTTAFASACQLGEAYGCARYGQALACGRGVARDDRRAIELLSAACEKSQWYACEQLVALGEWDGGGALPNDALERALVRGAFSSAVAGQADAGLETLAPVGGGRGAFARACIAIAAGRLDDAAEGLRGLDGGTEVAVAREVLKARVGGVPFPDAAWVGWGRAGRPELKAAAWVPADVSPGDRGVCHRPIAIESITGRDDFLRALALAPWRSGLDAPYSEAVVHAALRFGTDDDPVVRLGALSVLAAANRFDRSPARRELERVMREAAAARADGTQLTALLRLPRHVEGAAATADELAALEDAAKLPLGLPRRQVYDRFVRVLSPAGAVRYAFGATVDVIINLIDYDALAGWLERGRHSELRRAAVLVQLGRTLAGTDWMVYGYQAIRLMGASYALVPDASLNAEAEALDERLKRLRTGPHGMMAMGQWPWPRESHVVWLEHELSDAERLWKLAEDAK